MKKNVLIIGAGGVAHVAAHKAAMNNDALGDICMASRTQAKCDEIIESVKRKKAFTPYQVNTKMMSYAKEDAVFMHCLPAHRGEEVTDDVIDSPQSIVFDQAENRLHVQKAVMVNLMK